MPLRTVIPRLTRLAAPAPLAKTSGSTPIAMWWAFLETDNPILDAFYQLNRANTLDKARTAAEKIEAPGLNVVWANAAGDIGWWAAAKLPLLVLTVPLDLALLPFAAIGGLFG